MSASPSNRVRTALLVSAIALAAGASTARAEAPSAAHSLVGIASLSLDGGLAEAADASPTIFGTKGSRRWSFQAGYGIDVSEADNSEIGLRLGVEHFIADGLSLELDLDLISVNQTGEEDAFGGGATFLFRWYFWNDLNWGLYFDGGFGVAYFTNPVPEGGTRFNFTPQLGGGVSFEITEEMRAMIGVRWHHISNANTSSMNPGRDHVFVYGGVSLPF